MSAAFRVEAWSIQDVRVFTPEPFRDHRGFFVRTLSTATLAAAGIDPGSFVEESQSRSRHGVTRGLHGRRALSEGKLVRCSYGQVHEVIVDLRPWSTTFLECRLTGARRRLACPGLGPAGPGARFPGALGGGRHLLSDGRRPRAPTRHHRRVRRPRSSRSRGRSRTRSCPIGMRPRHASRSSDPISKSGSEPRRRILAPDADAGILTTGTRGRPDAQRWRLSRRREESRRVRSARDTGARRALGGATAGGRARRRSSCRTRSPAIPRSSA